MAAGILHFESPYNYQTASTRSALLILSMAFLLIVYTVDFVLSGSIFGRQEVLAVIDCVISVVLVILYILYLFFRYKSHAELYDDDDWVDDYQPDIPEAPGLDVTNADGGHRNLRDDNQSSEDDPILRHLTAIFLALFSFALIVFFANWIVTHVILTGATTIRFYGLFVVPVCLKADLHGEVILDALRGRMESAMVTTTNGALRNLYLLFPISIFLSRILGYPMNMVFEFDEIMVTALATFILAPIAARGRTTFLDGGLLLLMYV